MAEIAAGGTATANKDETTPEKAWQRRPVLASTARAIISLAPIVLSGVTALVLNNLLPRPESVPALLVRIAFILIASFIVLAVVDRQARKFLPLAALLQLSLLFPDQMPNRFKLALKAGSSRRLANEVNRARVDGISDERSLASEQLVLLATAIGDHDRRTRGHSERVRLFADLVAVELGLNAEERGKLQWAALIHDIGKIAVPAEILNKKGAPTKREWEILKKHPAQGEALAAPVAPWLGEWVHAVGGHHEKWDGSGYPRGLAGAAIPRAAAIVAVADSFEVMTAVRSYKKAMPLAEARAELTRCAGTHFDPEIVRALLSVSIGRLRGAMGIFAGLAHIPFIGPLTTAAAHAPDTVTAAVGVTTSGATAGLSMAAIGGAMVLGPTSPTGAVTTAAPMTIVSPDTVPEVVAQVVATPETTPAPEASTSKVASANIETVSSSRRSTAVAPTTTAAPIEVAPTTAPPTVPTTVQTEAPAVQAATDTHEKDDDNDKGHAKKHHKDKAPAVKPRDDEKSHDAKGEKSQRAHDDNGDRRESRTSNGDDHQSGKKSTHGSHGKDD